MKFCWFHLMPYRYLPEDFEEKYRSVWVDVPSKLFDPIKANELYNEYLDELEFADEVGFDGIMSNEHHASYWCMKPAVNLDAAVIAKVTKKVKIAILGNVIAINDPV